MSGVITKKKTAKKKTAERDPLPTKIRGHEKPVPFTEDFKWPGSNLITFTADSFHAWTHECLPWISGIEPMENTEVKQHGIAIGNKFFYLRVFPLWVYRSEWFFCTPRPTRSTLSIYRGETEAEIAFDGVVNIPVLCDNLTSPWMSLTPNEVLTQRGQIRRAKGDVGMAGLGLGWAARRVLQRKQVKHLTVYESDGDVAKFFGDHLKSEFGDKLTIVHADAYEVDWSQYDVSLWDIWPGVGDASYDKNFGTLNGLWKQLVKRVLVGVRVRILHLSIVRNE